MRALPGILPPRTINGHVCVDGAVESRPIQAALAVSSGPLIVVDVGGAGGASASNGRASRLPTPGASEIVMNTLAEG
ncbi:MAG: hypothetical protein R2882_09920 [Gemmatimonadales bacterium]